MADTHIKIKPVTPRVQYTANGSTTVFPYSFAIFDETDMVVYVDDAIITTGYTVSGAGQTDGGNVTFDSAPVDGTIITLLRNVPIERMTDFQEGGTFRPKNINDEFDRQTAFAQQVQEALSRCVKVDPTSESNPEEILPKIERLYDSADNIDIVANDKANVDAVAGNKTNIDAVAGNNAEISAVAGIASDVSTVAGNTTDISNVATNMSDVNDCAANIEAIQAAPSAASSAATSAQQAAISAAGTHLKLFHHDWFDYQLNDMAWLRADTFSWQDGTVYTNAYNHLVDDLGTIEEAETRYAWKNGNIIVYTTSESPSVGDPAYSYTNGSFIQVDTVQILVEDEIQLIQQPGAFVRDISSDINIPSSSGAVRQTETIGSYTITYWLATDGHKICLPDQETTTVNIYTESGVAWYYILDTANQRFKLPRTKYGFAGYRNSVGGFIENYGASGSLVHATQMYLYFYVGQFTQTAIEQTAGLNSELFNGKMDRDMSNMNPSTTAKETIVGWGMPDYSAGISLTSTKTEATSNGCIILHAWDNGNINIYLYSSMDSSDNIPESGVKIGCQAGSSSQNSIFVPVKKGMAYRIGDRNGGNVKSYFYPYIGG